MRTGVARAMVEVALGTLDAATHQCLAIQNQLPGNRHMSSGELDNIRGLALLAHQLSSMTAEALIHLEEALEEARNNT